MQLSPAVSNTIASRIPSVQGAKGRRSTSDIVTVCYQQIIVGPIDKKNGSNERSYRIVSGIKITAASIAE
jgi:hypothetical protein